MFDDNVFSLSLTLKAPTTEIVGTCKQCRSRELTVICQAGKIMNICMYTHFGDRIGQPMSVNRRIRWDTGQSPAMLCYL